MKPRDLIGTEGGWYVFRKEGWVALRVTAGRQSMWWGVPKVELTCGGGILCHLACDKDDPHLFALADETAARLKANALNTELQHAIIEAATKRLAELKVECEVLRNGGAG